MELPNVVTPPSSSVKGAAKTSFMADYDDTVVSHAAAATITLVDVPQFCLIH